MHAPPRPKLCRTLPGCCSLRCTLSLSIKDKGITSSVSTSIGVASDKPRPEASRRRCAGSQWPRLQSQHTTQDSTSCNPRFMTLRFGVRASSSSTLLLFVLGCVAVALAATTRGGFGFYTHRNAGADGVIVGRFSIPRKQQGFRACLGFSPVSSMGLIKQRVSKAHESSLVEGKPSI